MTDKPIRCDQHDYLEIACLYGYRLELALKDGQVITGRAMDVATVGGREYLLLEEQGNRVEIETNRLKQVTVLTPNARFSKLIL